MDGLPREHHVHHDEIVAARLSSHGYNGVAIVQRVLAAPLFCEKIFLCCGMCGHGRLDSSERVICAIALQEPSRGRNGNFVDGAAFP